MRLVDAYAETRHTCGDASYNAKSKEARDAVRAALASAAQSTGEPVAYLWQHSETGRTRVVMPDAVITADATWRVVGPLVLAAAPKAAPAQPGAEPPETLGVYCGIESDDVTDPTHPRYVAGFRAGHAAGKMRASRGQAPAPTTQAAPAQPVQHPGAAYVSGQFRTPQEYAIEHAEYLAQDAEYLLEAINHYNAQHDEDGAAFDEFELAQAQEAVSDAFRAVRRGINEFRKRRNLALRASRGLAPAPAAVAGPSEDEDRLFAAWLTRELCLPTDADLTQYGAAYLPYRAWKARAAIAAPAPAAQGGALDAVKTAEVLHSAVEAIYFDDRSKFKAALGAVVRTIDPALAHELLGYPRDAYARSVARLDAARAQAKEGASNAS